MHYLPRGPENHVTVLCERGGGIHAMYTPLRGPKIARPFYERKVGETCGVYPSQGSANHGADLWVRG